MTTKPSEMTPEEIASILDSLPDEQIAQDLASAYKDIAAGLRIQGRDLRTGNKRTVYPYTNLQQQQFQLIAEIQRYIQLHSDAFGVVANELGTIQSDLMKAYVSHLSEVRIVMSKLDSMEASTAEILDAVSAQKPSLSEIRRLVSSFSTRNSKIKADIEDELHMLSKSFSKDIGAVLTNAARRLKDELS